MIRSFSRNSMSERPIVIFGGGIYGEIAYHVITTVYHGSVCAVFDNKMKEVPWADFSVMRLDEIGDYPNADVLICAANAFESLCREMEKYRTYGIEIYDLREILKDYLLLMEEYPEQMKSAYLYGDIDIQDIVMKYCFFAGENNSYLDNKIVFSYFVLVITHKCSLRCKYCGAFCSKYNPQSDYDVSSLKKIWKYC